MSQLNGKRPWLPLLLLVCATLALPVQAGKIKCWKNSDGVRECGNVVPQEYVQQGHTEIDSKRFTKRSVSAAKSVEEIEREREAEARKAEQERLVAEQAAADHRLMQTFNSADDIVMTRDGKIMALNTLMRVTESQMRKIDSRIKALEQKQARGQKLTGADNNELQDYKLRLQRKKKFIDQKQREQNEVRIKYDADLKRFLELTRSAGNAPDVAKAQQAVADTTASPVQPKRQ